MKTLNLVKTLVVILVLSILVGCSDNITSSGEDSNHVDGKRRYPRDTEYNIPVKNVFRVEIGLKPYKKYTFNKSNTPFAKLTAFDIVNIAAPDEDKIILDCQDLKVYSNSSKYDKLLGCHGNGVNLSEITIENTSSLFISLSVELDGVRAKKFVDVVNE